MAFKLLIITKEYKKSPRFEIPDTEYRLWGYLLWETSFKLLLISAVMPLIATGAYAGVFQEV